MSSAIGSRFAGDLHLTGRRLHQIAAAGDSAAREGERGNETLRTVRLREGG